MKRHLLLYFLILLPTISLLAVETVVVGQVLDSYDKNPISGVNIFFKSTNKGVQSNEEGYFLIRHQGGDDVLVFSCVGFKRKELKIKQGQSAGMQVEMQEENTLLQDLFVLPGANPALEIMKQVRLRRTINDISRSTDYRFKQTEQQLMLLSKVHQRSLNQRLFHQVAAGSLSANDSMLVLPVYASTKTYQLAAVNRKLQSEQENHAVGSSVQAIHQLLGEVDKPLNFYDNGLYLFGRNFISPLSASGNAYYHYFLADSLDIDPGKQYLIRFRSKNQRNLSFNGQMWIDSATMSLTQINAELPLRANLNYVQQLKIAQQFERLSNGKWMSANESFSLNMVYESFADSTNPRPHIFISRGRFTSLADSIGYLPENFAQTEFAIDSINKKMQALTDAPLMKMAQWLADVLITGYVPVGSVDVGKLYQLARYTDVEGLRLNIPLRTNELFSKHFSLGGYVGYGFHNEEVNFLGYARMKLPTPRRSEMSVSYTNDYRRIDYDYHDYITRENPLLSTDVDISNTIFSFREGQKMNHRTEFMASISADINENVESHLVFRDNYIEASYWLPFRLNGTEISGFNQQALSFTTRFSSNNRVYDDHFQRIYFNTPHPVIFLTLEGGRFTVAENSGTYFRALFTLKQNVSLDFGQWNYAIETGWLSGSVPFPLLNIPTGSETYLSKRYHFNLMNHMEYATDKYVLMHNDLVLNGLLFNQIPLVNRLNLRELFTLKMLYGGMNSQHVTLLDFPDFVKPLQRPYVEVGAGVTNIFRMFAVQAFWRLTDLDAPGTRHFGVRWNLRIGF